ncbi:MAG: gliding motility-associated ABC transporter substrate-binding protein GldG, partial [Bacteroidota bacterium]
MLYLVLAILLLLVTNGIAGIFYKRFDLTRTKRYTLSEAAKRTVEEIDATIRIDILLGGRVPSEFRRLQAETRYLLEEFRAVNTNILFNFVDPLADEEAGNETVEQLRQLGLTPAAVTNEARGRLSQELVFPWALASYGKKTVRIPLLKNKLGATAEARITNSVQALEYAFTDAFVKLTLNKRKKIAMLKGNGELEDRYIADFITALSGYYDIAPFTLDSVAVNPEQTLNALGTYDLVLIAKPTEAFSGKEKYVLDQYLLNGGKMLWLIDKVSIEMEDLYNENGTSPALPRMLNLDDLFFKYGIRIATVLVKDLYFTQIVLASGEGNNSQYTPVPWVYSPMVFSANDHPINTNIEALRFQFANAIDTLSNAITKTVLLSSSSLSKRVRTPTEISLNMIKQQPDRATYNDGLIPLAVLLEGNFTSVFKNRVKPFSFKQAKDEGVATKVIVISDGDLIK